MRQYLYWFSEKQLILITGQDGHLLPLEWSNILIDFMSWEK